MRGNRNTIKNEWETYYKQLENIRRSGITNMYGASPYLQKTKSSDELKRGYRHSM